jgi:hypothetical protein
MCIPRSDVASALCAYCIHMLHAQQVHTLYDVAFALCAYIVRCRIHNMHKPRQMLHAHCTIWAFIVRFFMRTVRISVTDRRILHILIVQ